jgi:HlyD family secretion protein
MWSSTKLIPRFKVFIYMNYRLLLLLPLLLLSCRKSETISPTLQPITESVYASGSVKSTHQYMAHSTVSGIVDTIFVEEGEQVSKDQPVMRIVNATSRLNRQNSQLAADYEDMANNTGKLRQAAIAIELLSAKKKNDSLLLVRQKNLWAQRIGTLVSLEQSELAFKNTTTSYEQALLNYEEIKRELSFHSSQSKTNLKISSAVADDYLIRSLVNGKVYKIFPDRGELVNTVNPVAIIGDASDFQVELQVDEYDIARLRIGQTVVMTMDSYKGKVYKGRVEQIEPLMEEESRSFVVRASFLTRPAALYPNLSVQANIIIDSKAEALTIPRNYLLGDTAVVMANGEKVRVVVGAKDYQRAEITKGLTKSDLLQKPAQ